MGGAAVAACPARFLVVAFDVFGHVQVGNEAHVGLVDTHAEGDGGDHDDGVFPKEAVLVVLADFLVQTGVVGQGVDALGAQRFSDIFHAFARLAVDDARVALVFTLNEAQELLCRLFLLHDGVADVGTVKAADELF